MALKKMVTVGDERRNLVTPDHTSYITTPHTHTHPLHEAQQGSTKGVCPWGPDDVLLQSPLISGSALLYTTQTAL